MKNEIDSYRKSIIFSSLKIPSLAINNNNKVEDEIIYNKSADNEAPEIIIEELEPLELQQITDDFCVDLENENANIIKPENECEEAFNSNDENEDEMKITDIANTITKLQENDQKKIIENLEQKVKNDKLPKLLNKIEAIKKMKNLSRKIKERKRKKNEEEKLEEDKIKSMYENNEKEDLPEENLHKISNAFIKDIFDRDKEKEPEKDFHKDYLKEVVKRQKLKKAAKIINNLSDNDKKLVMKQITDYAEKSDEPMHKVYINKLKKIMTNLDKVKSYTKRIKQKVKEKEMQNQEDIDNKKNETEKDLDEQKIISNISNNLFNDENLNNKNIKENEENIEKAASDLTNFTKEEQDKILNKLREESNTPEKKEQMRKLVNKVEYLRNKL